MPLNCVGLGMIGHSLAYFEAGARSIRRFFAGLALQISVAVLQRLNAAFEYHSSSRPNLSLNDANPLFSCQPSVSLSGNAQTARFSKRRASPISQRHLAGFRNNLSRTVIPNAAVRLILSFLLHDRSTYAGGVKDRPNASVATMTSWMWSH
jgi:hypothetical protein